MMRTPRRTLRILALGLSLLAITAGLAACGDDDEDGDDDNGGEPAVTRPAGASSPSGGAPTAAPTAGEGEGDGAEDPNTVTATDFQFTPSAITISGATTITLKNDGSAPHTMTVYTDAEFTQPVDGADTGRISAGTESSFELNAEAGEHYFRCEVHPTQMQGTITVE